MSPRHFFAILALAPAIASAAPASGFSAEQTGRLRCAAAFAFVGSEQARGAPGWEGFPDLTTRAGKFIAFVGEGLMAETGRSREDIRGELGKAIAALENEGMAASDPAAMIRGQVRDCMGMMDQLTPAKP